LAPLVQSRSWPQAFASQLPPVRKIMVARHIANTTGERAGWHNLS
jgi:hypothetical protein